MARDATGKNGTNSRLAGFLTTTAVGFTAAAAFGAPAYAQEASKDTVLVLGHEEGEQSSVKSTAPLINTPQTIQIIPEDLFSEQGARNLTDVLRNTPGITFNAGENGFSTGLSNFSMRGFDASGNIFVDGARDSGSFTRDTFNIEQVEVVKGPSSDNGRGGAGGYVNLATKTPRGAAFYNATASVGFDDSDADARLRGTLDLNQPLSETAAARLNVLWEDGGAPGRDIASRGSFGFAPSVTLGLGSSSRFTAALQYVEQDDVPDWGVPAAYIDGMMRRDPAIDGKALRDTFYGLAADYDEAETTSFLARYERAFSSNLEFSTQLRWAQSDRATSFTVPTGYTPATQLVATQQQAYARQNESVSLLANLNASFNTGAFSHVTAFGVELTQEEADAKSFPTVNNPGGAGVPAFNPNPNRAGRSTVAATQLSSVEVNTLAAYFNDTIQLSPRWQATGGVRIENYEVSIDNTTVAGVPLGADGADISETMVSGRLGLVFKPVTNASLYASVGVSPQPPASFLSNSDISREGDNAFPGFSRGLNSEGARVQRSVNYELGGKWDLLNNRLSATAALFRTERQNVAMTGRTGVLASDPVRLLGYGEQIVQGLELGLQGQITENWSVFAGALFMESERKHSADLDLARCRADPGDFGLPATDAGRLACNPAANSTRGDELAFTPEFTANLWTSYQLPYGFSVGGGVQHVSESWAGRPDDAERIIPNGTFGVLPSYTIANAMVEYEVHPKAVLRLNIDNITDEFYAVSTNWPAQRILLGPPRSFLLSLNLKM